LIRVGIIGLGWAGQRHYQSASASGAEVSAIADIDEEKLKKRKEGWGVEHAFNDYREMLDSEIVDAVVIALPHDLHREVALRSAEAGLHILCEKPIAISVEEADAMIDCAHENGVILMVAESNRYDSLTEKIEDILRDNRIGTPVFATWNDLHKFDTWGYKDREWLNDPKRAGGGHWITRGIHLVSPLRAWFRATGAGDVHEVFAREYRSPSFKAPRGIEGNMSALLVFDGGQTARINMGVEVENYHRFNEIYIHGTAGSLVASRRNYSLDLYSGNVERPETLRMKPRSSFEREMQHFLHCIETNSDPRTSGIEERNSLAVVEAGYRSMSEDRAIEVEMRKS